MDTQIFIEIEGWIFDKSYFKKLAVTLQLSILSPLYKDQSFESFKNHEFRL